MVPSCKANLLHRLRKGYCYVLAFFWITGLLFGIWVYDSAEDSLLVLMRGVSQYTVSIVGLLCVTLLPFLLSAIAVFYSMPQLIFPICCLKGFLFSFVSVGVMQSFGSAGWLLRGLLLFSESTTMPLLYWYWTYCLSDRQRKCGYQMMYVLALSFLTASMDYRFISPFLVQMISNLERVNG